MLENVILNNASANSLAKFVVTYNISELYCIDVGIGSKVCPWGARVYVCT